MKNLLTRFFSLLLILMFILPGALAAEDAVTVVSVNATINGEASVSVPAGTKLTAIANTDGDKVLTDWRVNGVSQGTNEIWLLFTADSTTVVEAVFDHQAASPATAATAEPAAVPIGKVITAVNCNLQYLNDKGTKGAGTTYTELDFSDKQSLDFAVTAVVPKGKKIDYWIIDGAKYVFSSNVKSIVVTNAEQSMTFEVVYKNGEPVTLHTEAQIAAVTGTRTVTTNHAKFCFMKPNGKGAGGWLESFDFTQDYTNPATDERVEGGTITCKVKATVPNNKKVTAWKFNNTTLKFNTQVTWFNVKLLDHSMTYEPLFGKVQAFVTEKPAETKYYSVRCSGCTFSGGGYNGATSGRVPAGTRITVTAKASRNIRWSGTYAPAYQIGTANKSFSYTVKSDCNFSAQEIVY